MKFTEVTPGTCIETTSNHNFSSDMSGVWVVMRVDDFSFTVSRGMGAMEEHFSPCASVNFKLSAGLLSATVTAL